MNGNPRLKPRETSFMKGLVPYAFYQAETGFEHLESYLKMVSSHVDSEARSFNSKVEALIAGSSSEEESEYYCEIHADDVQMWDSAFPNIIACTVLISACSLLEASLTGICHRLEGESSGRAFAIRFRWTDFPKDRGIRRVNKFLANNLGILLHKHPKWQAICDYYQVRHAIVPGGGDLRLLRKEERKKVERVLARLKLAGNDGHQATIQLSKSFVESVLKDTVTFLKAIRAAFVNNAVVGPRYWP
jgi:hypothetical protein